MRLFTRNISGVKLEKKCFFKTFSPVRGLAEIGSCLLYYCQKVAATGIKDLNV